MPGRKLSTFLEIFQAIFQLLEIFQTNELLPFATIRTIPPHFTVFALRRFIGYDASLWR